MTSIKERSRSFEDAKIEASQILKKHQTQKSTWFGKQIYLGYNDETGWKILELDLFDRILRKMNLAFQDTHSKQVKGKLKELSNEELSGLIDTLPKLKGKLERILERKLDQPTSIRPITTETPSPTSKRHELTSSLSSLESLFAASQSEELTSSSSSSEPLSTTSYNEEFTLSSSSSEPLSATSQNDELTSSSSSSEPLSTTSQDSEYSVSPPVTTPLYLRNYKASRCYIDSVLEIMLSQDSIRQKIFQECARDDITQEKRLVLTRLRDLILVVDQTHGQGTDAQSPIGPNSPGEQVRNAIFASGLNPDLTELESLYTQQDAAAALLLINQLLDNTFKTVEVDNFEELFVERPIATNHKLELRLEEGWQYTLQSLLDQTFLPKESDSLRMFELSDGSEANLPYTTRTKLLTLPDSVALHLSRYTYSRETGVGKLTEPVALPQDGIVDLTPYYSGDDPGEYKYEITGYVIHHGHSLKSGHYTANIKIENKYYACDDLSRNFHKEISEEEFYGNQEAYLVMLKRLPQDSSPSVPLAA